MPCKCGEPIIPGRSICIACYQHEYEELRRETRRRLEAKRAAQERKDPPVFFASNVAVSAGLSPKAVTALARCMREPEREMPECFREMFI